MGSPVLTGFERKIIVGTGEVFLKVSGQSTEIPLCKNWTTTSTR